jgi:protease-4
MSQKNLLSIVRGPWAIDLGYAQDHLPLYLNMLKGNIQIAPQSEETPFPVTFQDLKGNEVQNRSQSSSNGNSDNQYVAVMSLNHPIYKYDQSCGPMGTQSYMRELSYLETDPSVAGIVLRIDSGGGQADGNAEFAAFLQDYTKPVVVHTNGLLASAAYYMAAGADQIISSPYAMSIGSIGTMMMSVNPKGMIEKEGGKLHLVYATKSTRKNHAFNQLILEDDTTSMREEVLDPLQATFESDVKRLRPGIDNAVFNGDVFNPSQALELGMIDSLGSLSDAVNSVVTLSRKREQENNSTNQNTTMETTPRPALQSVLGIEEPLASTEENGSYLNAEQLDAVEQSLVAAQEGADTLVGVEASLTTAQESLTAATDAAATTQTAIASALGLEQVEGQSSEDVHASIIASIATLRSSKPAKTHTQTAVTTNAQGENNGLDMSQDHNQRLNKAFKF